MTKPAVYGLEKKERKEVLRAPEMPLFAAYLHEAAPYSVHTVVRAKP